MAGGVPLGERRSGRGDVVSRSSLDRPERPREVEALEVQEGRTVLVGA